MAEAKWYVVHTYSGYENKVKANIEKTIENNPHLAEQILEVQVPLQDVVEMKNGKQVVVQKKMFPGYVLLNMDMNDDTWYVVRNTRGVTGFVGPGSKPVALTDDEVRQWGLEPDEGESAPFVKKSSLGFAVGDVVNVKEGVMFGISEVTVREISSDESKVTCSAFMFGRETVIELDAADLSPIK